MQSTKRFGVLLLAVLYAGVGCRQQPAAVTPLSPSEVAEFDSAVRDGDTSIISRLLQAKPQMINAKDENGKTPLTIATEKGDTEMADMLRRKGGHE